ncbi:hypothetical protein HAX54_027061, partial [Datura stramonium]|nr:hypothetical protein [Datura stramonium]
MVKVNYQVVQYELEYQSSELDLVMQPDMEMRADANAVHQVARHAKAYGITGSVRNNSVWAASQ